MSGEFSITQAKNGFIVLVGHIGMSNREVFIAKTIADVLNIVKVTVEKK